MNREIKFRAWNKPTKQMFYWGFFTDIFDKGANDRRNFEPEHNIWMQYTGLHDKNGKEIYRGDIVKYNTPQREMISKIEFPKDWEWLSWNCSGTEIIGNIMENPELLK